jgi:peptide/nickel transport system substrate-binding protein
MKANQRLVILQPGVRLIDPHINTDDRNTLSPLLNIFETLVTVGKQGGYVGGLAQRWEVAADARQWTFHLRQPVYFHHGERLTAGDVVASIDRILNPKAGGELATQGIYQGYLGGAKIDALDEFTVQIVTPAPIADLLDFLVKFPIAPRSQFKDLPEMMSGTGPYRLTRFTPGQIEMTAFDGYWGGEPATRQVIWEAEPDPQRRVEALLNGQADLVSDVPPTAIEEIRSTHNAFLTTIESSVCTVFMCNNTRGICTDRRIRQALNYGLDQDDIIQSVMNGAARPLNGPLTVLHFGYNPDTPAYAYDPDRAKALLAEAGYPQGLELVLDVPLTLPNEARALVQRMAAQYRRIGINTVVNKFADRTEYAHRVRSKQIDDACCFDSSPLSTFQILSDKFHSGLNGVWWQGYQNLQVDALIDQARATPDSPRRQVLYQQAYQLINEDAPWIFLYNPVLMWGVGPAAEEWQPKPDGLIHLG